MASIGNSLSSGSRVKLHSLKRSNELNHRIGTILRSPTNQTDRYEVYLADLTTIIRVLPKNLTILPNLPPTASERPALRHTLTFNAFRLSALPDFGYRHLYYPFGNTAPEYVFPGISREVKAVRVLLLACGDLRSPFYSLSRDSPRRLACKRRIEFFVNDFTPETIARNLVILWLIYRSSASVEMIFAIWFSLRIPITAYCAFVDAALALTGPNADKELKGINVSFHEINDWQTVRSILESWITWQDALAWDVVTNMRRTTIPQVANMSVEQLAENKANVLMFLYATPGGDRSFPTKAGEAEVRHYIRTGVIRMTETPEYTNPTLFQRPDRYSLHYGSDPFSAFPRFAERYDPDTPCMSNCMQQMTSWIKNLREHGDNVSWTFSTANCLDLCTKLSGPFDAVSTSNVSDHVGLMPLLQILRGITTPAGTLLTKTLRFSTYSKSVEEYLQKHLIVGPEFYESMLGWRCLGHDGNLTPRDGNVLFSVPSLAEVVLSSMGRKKNGVGSRCELSLIWKASRDSNVPLCLRGNENIQRLVKTFLPEVYSFPYANEKVVSCKTRPEWSFRTTLTILPVLLSGVGADELLFLEDDNAIELRDLALCIKEDKLSEMKVATIQVSDDALREHFITWKSFGPLLELNVIVSHGKRPIPYCGLSRKFDAASRTWYVSWLIHRNRFNLHDSISLHTHFSRIKSCTFEDAEVKEANAEDYFVWLRRISCNRTATHCRWRTEDANTWTVPIKVSDAWMEALNAKKSVNVSVAGHTGSMTVGVGQGLAHPVVIDLPGPIDAAGTKLKVSRKLREVKCVVKKGKYKISSLLLADSWIGDRDAWVPMENENEGYLLTVCGMQMTDEEKYISRTRDIAPPLIAAKDTFMFFFQCHQESYMALSFRDSTSNAPDVRAIVAHHGLRREHRTGVPAADLSVCFLELSFLGEMGPWLQKVVTKCRHLYCTQEELDLLKQFFDLFASRCKDECSWEGEPSKAPIPNRAIRRRFERMLLQPLFSPSLVTSFFNMSERMGDTSDRSAQAIKKKGTELCKSGNYKEAVPVFRSAVLKMKIETPLDEDLSEDSRKLMAQCFLNLAYCTLQDGEVRNLEETIESCDFATAYIETGDNALLAKARFRKGLALEMLGKVDEAFVELKAARRLSNDKTVLDAFDRVRDMLNVGK